MFRFYIIKAINAPIYNSYGVKNYSKNVLKDWSQQGRRATAPRQRLGKVVLVIRAVGVRNKLLDDDDSHAVADLMCKSVRQVSVLF